MSSKDDFVARASVEADLMVPNVERRVVSEGGRLTRACLVHASIKLSGRRDKPLGANE